MIESAEEPLAYIFNTFKEGSKVDLRAIKNYFDASTSPPTQTRVSGMSARSSSASSSSTSPPRTQPSSPRRTSTATSTSRSQRYSFIHPARALQRGLRLHRQRRLRLHQQERAQVALPQVQRALHRGRRGHDDRGLLAGRPEDPQEGPRTVPQGLNQ